MSVVDNLLGRLERVRRNGAGWMARCPAHEDANASLSVSEGDDGRALIHCHAGCKPASVVQALGLRMADLFEQKGGERGGIYPLPQRRAVRVVRVDGEPVDTSGGLTVEQLAEAKQLPVELLAGLGCETVPYFGPPSVQIPYANEDGEVVGIRYRISLSGDTRFRWKKGTKASSMLYGASRLAQARDAGYVFLVEGESDAWTLMHHGQPVVAVPGANMWSAEHAARLDGIGVVYAVVEPDKGGETLLEALRASTIREQIRIVRLRGAKDVSELHMSAGGADVFGARFREAMEAAETLLDIESERRREMAKAQWERCQELAREPGILAAFADELRARSFVGSTQTAQLVFLVMVSRLLPRPVSLVLRGLSSAGKSYTVESVLPFFGPTAYLNRSGMSDRALVYTDEDFRHRMIYIAEAEAIAGDGLSAYFLRTLISENRIVYEVVEKVDDQHVTRQIVKPGPTGLILTTTRLRLHAENETRMLSLTVSDDPSLTRQIMRAIALRDDEAQPQAPEAWRALQRWLELAGERRVVDADGFLLALADLVPVVAVRLRRDFMLVRSLIHAHAILHQASRERDAGGRIVATLDDYAAIRELVNHIVSEGIGATVPDDVRATVSAVEAVIAGKGEPEATATRAEVQAELVLDERATRRRLAQAVDGGWLVNRNPGRGKTAMYAAGDPIPDDVDVLPAVDVLRQAILNQDNPDSPATDRGVLDPPLSSIEDELELERLERKHADMLGGAS